MTHNDHTAAKAHAEATELRLTTHGEDRRWTAFMTEHGLMTMVRLAPDRETLFSGQWDTTNLEWVLRVRDLVTNKSYPVGKIALTHEAWTVKLTEGRYEDHPDVESAMSALRKHTGCPPARTLTLANGA